MDERYAKHVSWFQQLIGIFLWAVGLRSIDIQIEFVLLLQYQTLPQKYHIEALYLIFHFLSKNPKKILVMETSVPSVDESIFNLNTDWEDLYGDVVEEEPHLIPETLGRTVYVEYFVDTDHSGNFITRHPHSGILLFINNDLMKSFIKRKNTVESITFGSELVALRISRNMIVEIRIKLKLFEFPLAGP